MDSWVQIITGLFTLLGGISGGWITSYVNGKAQKDKLSIEFSREREKEKQLKEEEKMEIYNSVLKVDGEHIMVTHIGGHFTELDTKIYKREIRPILYQKLHLINKDVANTLWAIDNKLAECEFNEDIEPEDDSYLSNEYWTLIENIREHIDDYRDKKAREI
ncbi:hypothetical protein [Halobacillus sp. H74]|uniref:hypothetical protein n=1 Tax=Halobacillus sp. H74 TaxID=3457436 RepID=UPI003FCD00E0